MDVLERMKEKIMEVCFDERASIDHRWKTRVIPIGDPQSFDSKKRIRKFYFLYEYTYGMRVCTYAFIEKENAIQYIKEEFFEDLDNFEIRSMGDYESARFKIEDVLFDQENN